MNASEASTSSSMQSSTDSSIPRPPEGTTKDSKIAVPSGGIETDARASSNTSNNKNNTSSNANIPRPSSPTSASSRLWSSWISPSTSASTAASSAFEERKRRRRPSFEEFRAQEPPQARLIRLRGLFDVLLDKDDEQALAGGRAKEEWTRSAMRARYGAGGIYARGSLAPHLEESKSGSRDITFGFSSQQQQQQQQQQSQSASSPSASSSLRSNSNTPTPPRQSYAKELLSQCRECRAELEKEREAAEKKGKKILSQQEGGESKGWSAWVPFMGNGGEASSDAGSGSNSESITDKLANLVGKGKDSSQSEKEEKSDDASSISSITSSVFSVFSSDSSKSNDEEAVSEAKHTSSIHSDHEGEAGWIGSGVWGLSAVGSKQRQADRERDRRIAKGHVEDDGGRRQRQIEWEGFLRYADQKERELYKIFIELDKNADMRLDTAEIATALDRAEIALSKDGLQDFVASLGSSSRWQGSGCPSSVTFPEFRDYLLLLPRKPSVNEIFRFYQVRKAFGLFGSQGIFAEFSDRWGKTERHGATSVTQDGDVSLAGEERMKLGEDEKEARREARRAALEMAATEVNDSSSDNQPESETNNLSSILSSRNDATSSSSEITDNNKEVGNTVAADEEEDDSDMIHGDVALKFLLAGGIAGAVSRTATAPFDRLKIYLITTARSQPEVLNSGSTSKIATRGVSMLSEAVQALYREGGGVRAFWVGNGLNCLKIFPESAIKFLSYETAKRAFAKYVDGVSDSRDISGTSRFLSGGFGGITSQFAIYPVETLKTRLMSYQGSGGNIHAPADHKLGQQAQGNRLLSTVAKDMWKNGGMRTYYRGLTAGLIGVFPYSAIDMSTFEGIKLFYIKYTGKEEPGVLALLAFGSLSGSVGATTVYPLSLVRTRLQAAGTPAHPQQYDGFWHACRITYKQEGFVGFYRGLVPSLAKVVPAVSISYVVYEHSKRRLGVQ
ncbi:hypothetical protein L7F22_019458 [Adiantum nelumboides]|nr:hypothetical protein [Adiantum nelumboides]